MQPERNLVQVFNDARLKVGVTDTNVEITLEQWGKILTEVNNILTTPYPDNTIADADPE